MSDEKFFVHKTSIIDDEVLIGEGTKIWAFTHVRSGTSIGKNCVIGEGVHIGLNVKIGNNVKIQNHALIYEGLVIQDDVFIGPGVVTTNDFLPDARIPHTQFKKTYIEKGASIGANSTIVCGVRIGANSLVGAGSVVTKNIDSETIVVGNPAKFLRKM